jgi:hypothetical protein
MASSIGTRAKCEEWRMRDPARRGPDSYVIESVAHCGCCGASTIREGGGSICTWGNGETRCARHHDRNPCAIEGCARTTLAPNGHLRSDQWLCSEHWRRFVPARSMRRRAYHAFWRKAKRYGWNDKLVRQFNRFWDQLIATARAKAGGGSINKAEIDRLFGW